MAPVNRPVVHLRAIPNATAAERALRDRWEAGAP
jgi:hypothetical protein